MQEWVRKNSAPVKRVVDLPSSTSPVEALSAMQAATEHEHASALDLDSGMRERLESHFGPMVSKVRFVQSDLPASFGTKALAQGDTVRVAPGAYTPGTQSGERILSHELGHIVQQSHGQGMGGLAGLPMVDSAVESGADSIAHSAMSGPGLGISATPAAASAPMLGIGMLAKIRGFLRRRNMSDEEKEEIDRLIASRSWKVRMNEAKDKYNPTGDPKVKALQDTIRSGITDDMSKEEKLRKLQDNFAEVTGNGDSLKKGLPVDDPSMDPEGVMARMLNMCRTLANFNDLGNNIGGFGRTKPEEKGEAMMSVDYGILEGGKTIMHFNPTQTGVVENMGYQPKPDKPKPAQPTPDQAAPDQTAPDQATPDQAATDQTAAAQPAPDQAAAAQAATDQTAAAQAAADQAAPAQPAPDQAAAGQAAAGQAAADQAKADEPEEDPKEKRRKAENAYWFNSKLGRIMGNLGAGNEYAGNHELGHAIGFMLARKQSGFFAFLNFAKGKMENSILGASIRHLLRREKKNKYNYSGKYGDKPRFSDHFKDDESLTFGDNRPEGRYDKLNHEQGPGHFVARDRQTGNEYQVQSAAYNEAHRRGLAEMSQDPEAQKYVEELKNAKRNEPAQKPATVYDTNNPKLTERFVDTRSQGQKNLNKLAEIGETSFYGSTLVTENIAESVAQVEAMGKGASREAKQVYKRLWRELNPDAAYWEYRLKKEKKKSNDPKSRYFQERQRQEALKAAKK